MTLAMSIKGLIVKEPYASLIVKGLKSWEIRKYPTKFRGIVVIITKGKALGFAELYDVRGPISIDKLIKFWELHRVSYEKLKEYASGKDLYIWLLRKPVKFNEPIKINMPRGVQVWVNIKNHEIIKLIQELIDC